jgi:hypothetical protein
VSSLGRAFGDSSTPKRVRVTSPRRTARPRGPGRTPRAEIEEETGLGEVYVDSLVRAQLRLSLAVLGGLTLVVGALPALFILAPMLHRLTVGPVPLPWFILLGLIYPFAFFLARTYVRAAERVERDFTELVHKP